MQSYPRARYGSVAAIAFLAILGIALFTVATAQAERQYDYDCSACHHMPPLDSAAGRRDPDTGAFKGSHGGHAGTMGASCVKCHGATVTSTAHRDGKIQLQGTFNDSAGASYSRGTFFNQTSVPPEPLGTCSNVNCHYNTVTPEWGSAPLGQPYDVSCGTCHSATPATNAHSAHLAHYGNGVSVCARCHADHTAEGASAFQHATSAGRRAIDVKLAGGGSYASPVCSNLYCHSPGQNATGGALQGGDYARPSWNAPASGACGSCHATTAATSGSHGAHLAGNSNCGNCHAGASATSTDLATHVDGNINVGLGGYSKGTAVTPGQGAYGRCLSASCHASPYGSTSSQTPVWGTAVGCAACHNGAGAFTANGAPATGGHSAHMALAGAVCGNCHTGAVSGVSGGATHTNGKVEVAGRYTPYSSVTKHPIGTYTGTCTNASCHNDGNGTTIATPIWGASIAADCSGCHGGAAGAAVVIATGKHRSHVNNDSTLGRGNDFACADCHAKTVAPQSNTVITTATNHLNRFKDYSGVRAGGSRNYTASTGGCGNVYCHSSGQATPVYRNMTGSKAWGGTARLDCNGCHGNSQPPGFAAVAGAPNYPNGGAGSATANSHNKHVAGAGVTSSIGCAKCHYRTVDSAAANKLRDYSSAHLDRVRSVSFSASASAFGVQGRYSSTRQQCLNTYCHGAAASPSWGTASLACNACHSATASDAYWAANSAHRIHWQGSTLPTSYTAAPGNGGDATGYRFACSSCHGTPAVHAGGPANANGAAEIFFGYTSSVMKGSYSYGTTQAASDNGFKSTNGGAGCSTSYCHSNGQNGPGQAVSWTTTASTGTCVQCHDTKQTGSTSTGLSGKHNAHMNPTANVSLGAGNGLDCVDCHAKTVSNNTTIKDKTKHVNKFVDYSSMNGGGSARYSAPSHTCSNIYCHSNGDPAALVYVNPPAWNSSATLSCNGCHGTGSALGAPDYSNGGSGTATSNSHGAHVAGATDTRVCANCHAKTASSSTGFAFKPYSAGSYHLNGKPNVFFDKTRAGATASFDPASQVCSNLACHGGGSATWGGAGGCLACHSGPINKRVGIGPQFSGNSHHVQGTTVTGAHCYQCHWEANSDGTINSAYHHSATPGSAVELVVYVNGARPLSYSVGSTAVQYQYSAVGGKRAQKLKINTHCLGCHSDAANAATPFGDGKTPKAYSWDSTSIATKYGDAGTTPWGKYSGNKVTPKNTVTKAYSAHGNALNNKGGWDLNETWTDRKATSIVLCFDCHNSHGSTVTGTTTSYVSATTNGGILKDTTAGLGGYTMTYKPAGGGSAATHNTYNAGADLCFDCHMTSAPGGTPWGYNATFGSTQMIMGYFDSVRFGNTTSGSAKRFPYKAMRGSNMGGHFGGSSSLSTSVMGTIGGLCTPCHDPHGVSPTLGANKVYGVPMLKGTWMTSPYKEDVAPLSTSDNRGGGRGRRGNNSSYGGASTPGYNIDQNTFSTSWNLGNTSRVTQTVDQFAGLCIRCHPKSSIAPTPNPSSPTPWKSTDRIHNSVKGWGTYAGNASNKVHSYTCSKCHAAHNSYLPRLMATNCLDYSHRGRVATGGPTPISLSSDSGGRGGGSGGFPGGGSGVGGSDGGWGGGGGTSDDYFFGDVNCHDKTNSASYPANQLWNVKTPWGTAKPASQPSGGGGGGGWGGSGW